VVTKDNKIYYNWSVTGATSVTSTSVSNKPSVCGGNISPWKATTTTKTGGYISPSITTAQAGCIWTVTITAQNATNGTSASKAVTINYSIPNPTVSLFLNGDKKTVNVTK